MKQTPLFFFFYPQSNSPSLTPSPEGGRGWLSSLSSLPALFLRFYCYCCSSIPCSLVTDCECMRREWRRARFPSLLPSFPLRCSGTSKKERVVAVAADSPLFPAAAGQQARRPSPNGAAPRERPLRRETSEAERRTVDGPYCLFFFSLPVRPTVLWLLKWDRE